MSVIQRSLNKYSFSNIYNIINLSFSSTFLLIGGLFIPFEGRIQKGQVWTLDIFCDAKMSVKGLNGLLPLSYMFSMWVSTLCYIISELWSSVMIGYAFYTLSNYTCTEKEMKEVVPYFSSITAFSMIISALLFFFNEDLEHFIPTDSKMNPSSLFFLGIFFLTILIFLMKGSLISMSKGLEKSNDLQKQNSSTISSLLTSRFLRNMCYVALFYAVNAGFIDMSFKNGLASGSKIQNIPADIYSKKFLITVLLIIATTTLAYNFIFKKCFKTKGIFFPSIVPPISAIIFVIVVALLSFYNFYFGKYYSIINLTIDIENWLGSAGMGFSKITKYVLFDLAKEMISMRISPKYRYKYKSVYDGICIKLGKSMVSLYGAILTFLGVNDIRQASPLTLGLLLFINICWIKCVFYLIKKYEDSVNENKEIDVENEQTEK
ncbi:hypothetical protein P3W45_000388 [Vairimorpha bombi]